MSNIRMEDVPACVFRTGSAQSSGSKTIRCFLKPSPSDWEEFANSLIKAGAYSWDGHKFEEQITDGVEFEIWVTFRHRIKLSCYHRFPQKFSIFLDAINALTKASPDSPFYFTCDD